MRGAAGPSQHHPMTPGRLEVPQVRQTRPGLDHTKQRNRSGGALGGVEGNSVDFFLPFHYDFFRTIFYVQYLVFFMIISGKGSLLNVCWICKCKIIF